VGIPCVWSQKYSTVKNTAFGYIYRDGSNNKNAGEVIFTGGFTPEQLERLERALDDRLNIPDVFLWSADADYDPDALDAAAALRPGEYVIGEQDHCWHEFTGAIEVDAQPTLDNTMFVLRKKITETCWQIEDLSNGRILERESAELLRLYRTGDLRFGWATLALPGRAAALEISKSDHDMIEIRRRYVTAVEGLPISKDDYQTMIDKVWQQLVLQADRIQEHDPGLASLLRKRFDWTTVLRWTSHSNQFDGDSGGA
jgi:hypothetical protein